MNHKNKQYKTGIITPIAIRPDQNKLESTFMDDSVVSFSRTTAPHLNLMMVRLINTSLFNQLKLIRDSVV